MFLMSFTDIFLALPSMLSNGYFKYLFKAWFTDSDCCVESVFLGIRSQELRERRQCHVKGTRFCGGYTGIWGHQNFRVIALEHIIPNILGPVIVAASLGVWQMQF